MRPGNVARAVCLACALAAASTACSPPAKPGGTAQILTAESIRPPATQHTLRVVLRNPTGEPRWFVVAAAVEPPDLAGAHQVEAAEVFEVGPETAAVSYARLYGARELVVFRVRAKAELTLDGWLAETAQPGEHFWICTMDGLRVDAPLVTGLPAAAGRATEAQLRDFRVVLDEDFKPSRRLEGPAATCQATPLRGE